MNSKFISRLTQFEQGSTLVFEFQLMSGTQVMEMSSPDLTILVSTSQLSNKVKIFQSILFPDTDIIPEGVSIRRKRGSFILTLQPEFLAQFTPGYLTFDISYGYEMKGLNPLSINNLIKTNFLS